MQAFVRSKHTQSRRDEARPVLDLESLKMPVPDLDGPRQSQANRPRQLGEIDTAGRDHGEMIEANKHFRSTPSAAPRTRPFLPLTPDDLAGFDDIDNFDAGFTAIPGDRLEQLKQQKLADMQQGLLIDKYIDGDSYPDTTSGRPSDDDTHSLSRLPIQPQVFAAPFKRKAEDAMQQQKRHSTAAVPPSVAPLFGRNDNDAAQSLDFQMARRGQPVKKNSDQYNATQKNTRSHFNAQSRNPAVGVQPSESSVAEQIPMTTSTRSKDLPVDPPSHKKPGLANPTAQLDYDEGILENMQYEDLKHETFDLDPRTLSSDLRDNVELGTLSPEHWSEHFQNLDIDKWEEAGDWLIGQYADTLERLKAIRQGRRETARAYEKEVEQRHDLIVKRRIVIRDTMEGMRTHGTQVLIKNAPS